jgi:hypothetical protein
LIVISSSLAAFAAHDRATLIKRFDQRIVPAVEKTVRRPATNQGGTIAWGTS